MPRYSLFWWLCFFAVLSPLGHLRIPTFFSSVGLMSLFYIFFISFSLIQIITSSHQRSFVALIKASVIRHPIFFLSLGVFLTTLLYNASRTQTLHGWGIVIEWFLLPLSALLLFCLLSIHAKRSYQIKDIALVSLLGLVSFLATTTPFVLLSISTYDERLAALWQSPNSLAMCLAPWIIAVLFCAWHTSGALRVLSIALGMMGCLTLAQTASLGSIGALCIILFVFIAFSLWNHAGSLSLRKKILYASMTISVIFLCVWSITHKFDSAYHTPERTPLDARIMIWHTSLDLLRAHPLTGIPLGSFQENYLNYQKYYPPYLEWAVPHPHNTYLFLWLSGGWLTLVSFYVMLAYVLYALHQKRSALALLLISIILLITILGFFDTKI